MLLYIHVRDERLPLPSRDASAPDARPPTRDASCDCRLRPALPLLRLVVGFDRQRADPLPSVADSRDDEARWIVDRIATRLLLEEFVDNRHRLELPLATGLEQRDPIRACLVVDARVFQHQRPRVDRANILEVPRCMRQQNVYIGGTSAPTEKQH